MFKIININLTNQKIDVIDGMKLHQEFIGGVGVNTKLAYDHIPPGNDPLGPNNVLIFGAGSLVGTLLPTAARTELTAKSPLNNRFGSANSGGLWGAALKFAGYSHIVITGKSPGPVYIIIDDGQIKIKDATDLWGLDTRSTVNRIKKAWGNQFQIACIGPAGEKLVRFASVQNNFHGAWGRTGMGAVMGGKNLKAVAVRGTGAARVADRRAFVGIMSEAFEKVLNSEHFGYTRRYGSMVVADPYNKLGILPGQNFTRGSFPDWVATRGRKFFTEKYKEKDLACFSCPVGCAHWSRVRQGLYQGFEVKGLEVTYTFEFGAKLGIKDIAEILKCVEVCNLYGMDVISAAGVIAFAIECNQHGLLNKQSRKVPKEWGDFASIMGLLKAIGERQGIGDLLAEGVKIASEQIADSVHYAMHVKGVEMPVRDPRGKWDVWTLGYLTNTRGGDHLRTRSPVEMLLSPVRNHLEEELGVTGDVIRSLDMPEDIKKIIFGEPPAKVDIPLMAKYAEDLLTIINSTGLCIRPPVHRTLGPDFYARSLSAVLGHPFTTRKVMRAAAKIWDVQHEFNLREGERIEEYSFPRRFYAESIPFQGGTRPPLIEHDIEENVSRYFAARSWKI